MGKFKTEVLQGDFFFDLGVFVVSLSDLGGVAAKGNFTFHGVFGPLLVFLGVDLGLRLLCLPSEKEMLNLRGVLSDFLWTLE